MDKGPSHCIRLIGVLLMIAVVFVTSGAGAADAAMENTTASPFPPPDLQDASSSLAPQDIPTTLVPDQPPRVVLIRTETGGMTSTVFGTAVPGSMNTTITRITWEWGDNSTIEEHGFPHSHTYSNPGTYTLSVTAFQSDGRNTTETDRVSIARPVVPAMTLIDNPVPFQPAGHGVQASAPVLTLLEPVINGMNVTVNGNLNAGSPGVTIETVSVDWDDGNTTNVTDLPAGYHYTTAGIFTVNITGVQSDGQSVTKGITLDIRSGTPGPEGLITATPPQDEIPVFLIILLTATVVVALLGIAQRFIFRKREHSPEPDIPKAVFQQEQLYHDAKGRGDLFAATASARLCGTMFRSLAEQSPKMRTIYLELAEKWEEIARTTANPPVTQSRTTAAPEQMPSKDELEAICAGTDVSPDVAASIIRIAMEIGREGREGQSVGTSFVVGDTATVMNNSRQFVLNPFHGHEESDRRVTDEGIRGNIKEFAQLDGAFIVSGNGVVESAGRYITVDMSRVKVPNGLGSRHSSIAGITMVTRSIGIVVSQSGGLITIFKEGKIVSTIGS